MIRRPPHRIRSITMTYTTTAIRAQVIFKKYELMDHMGALMRYLLLGMDLYGVSCVLGE